MRRPMIDDECGCESCGNYGISKICSECAWDSKWEPKPMTNGDRIRAMSNEELAKFLDECNSQGCVYPARDCRQTCNQCIVEWLKEVDDE